MIGEFYTTVGIYYTNKEKNQLEMDIKFKVYCEQHAEVIGTVPYQVSLWKKANYQLEMTEKLIEKGDISLYLLTAYIKCSTMNMIKEMLQV